MDTLFFLLRTFSVIFTGFILCLEYVLCFGLSIHDRAYKFHGSANPCLLGFPFLDLFSDSFSQLTLKDEFPSRLLPPT